MRKTFLGMITAVLSSLSVPASAADLAPSVYTKAPAVVPSPLYDWSGFYIGINGGGGSSHNCWDLVTNPTGAPVIPAAAEGCHDGPAARSVVKSVTGGSSPIG